MGFDLIGGGQRELSGEELVSVSPATPGERLWSGTPVVSHVGDAVLAAREALGVWARAPIERRAAVLQRFAAIAADRADETGRLISRETGKALWDASGEGKALAAKVAITLDDGPGSGRSRVAGGEVGVSETRVGRCSYRPHGVMAVVGPFNFPAHLPNGHIVPALLMGNTVVFKPSEKTPAVGEALARMYREALEAEGFPAGVVNLVQGGRETSVALTTHAGVDGILFTGSWPVGRKILENNLDRPGRIVALEMGGNNPAVVMDDADLRQAAIEVVRGAFVTTGQRCTCTRRVIVHEAVAERFVGALAKMTESIVVGGPEAEGVFFGPPVTRDARDAVVSFQERLAGDGGEVLVPCRTDVAGVDPDAAYVTPGLVRVDRFTSSDGGDAGCDVEVFGPLLRVSVVGSFDEAMAQANATRYGLAASVFTGRAASIERFLVEARAGCVNVNCATAGASGKLPFGGLGASGNHRPAGSASLEYCAYPVASLIESGDAAGLSQGMGFDEGWLG
ncbi:MAG: aldehyde dehydrogenase family protein [Planctomycetota bacterium]